jgi:hypothetical protein
LGIPATNAIPRQLALYWNNNAGNGEVDFLCGGEGGYGGFGFYSSPSGYSFKKLAEILYNDCYFYTNTKFNAPVDMTSNKITNVSLITFYDSSYNNTKIDIGFAAAGTGSSQDYIQIACNGTRYGGLFGGGLAQSVGGFFYIKFY